MFPRVFLLALWLAGVAWGQSSLVISEFLASNSQVLADADGITRIGSRSRTPAPRR